MTKLNSTSIIKENNIEIFRKVRQELDKYGFAVYNSELKSSDNRVVIRSPSGDVKTSKFVRQLLPKLGIKNFSFVRNQAPHYWSLILESNNKLRNIIREEIRKILNEKKVLIGKFNIEHNSGNSAKELKNYIKNIPNIKTSIYPSGYQHHTTIEVEVPDKQTASLILKKWKEYGLDWPQLSDFK